MKPNLRPRPSNALRSFLLPLFTALWMALHWTLPADPAQASMCDSNENPAATLLLPYFEVNLDYPDAGNTIFSINNALAEPALAHVVLWTDWSHPTIDFDVFLTGYDVLQVNLGDVFLTGNVPITADEQSDPQDLISPHGGFRSDGGFVSQPYPERDGSYAECEDFFPFYQNPLIFGDNFSRLVDGHTGQPLSHLDDKCLGADFGDNIARGYVTVDVVNRCSVDVPSDPEDEYFAPNGTGVASNVNQLWGDWIYFDRENGFAQGDSLIHIEALDGFDALGDGTSDPLVSDPATGYTFYARYTEQGEDNREPLGTSWAARYLNNVLFSGGTDLYVWRDPTVNQTDPVGYDCGGPTQSQIDPGPAWYPLNESLVIAFDEYENAVDLCSRMSCGNCSPPFSYDPDCFPLSTQKIGSDDLWFTGISSPWGAGWMYLDLRLPAGEGAFDGLSQSHVSVTHSAVGLLSIGLSALELTSACSAYDDSQNPDV